VAVTVGKLDSQLRMIRCLLTSATAIAAENYLELSMSSQYLRLMMLKLKGQRMSMILWAVAECQCTFISVRTVPLEPMDLQTLLKVLYFCQLAYLMILVSLNQKWKFLEIMD